MLVDPSPKQILYVASMCSGFSVFSMVLFLPLLTYDVTEMQHELDLEMQEVKIFTDDIWTDLMDIRKTVPTLPQQQRQRIRKRSQIVAESLDKTATIKSVGDDKFEKLAAYRQEYEAQQPSYESYNPEPKCECEQQYNKCPPGYPGPPGTPGEDGYNGYPGSMGTPGIPGIAKEYETEQHGEVFCPPCPPGPHGKPGYQGKEGYPGAGGTPGRPGLPPKHGKPGKPGYPGKAGHPGEAGKQGYAGKPGQNGVKGGKGYPGPKGKKGYPGAAGNPGKSGRPGKDGYPGKDGPVGPPGSSGYGSVDGKPGAQGVAGEPGPDAHYCSCPKRGEQQVYPSPNPSYPSPGPSSLGSSYGGSGSSSSSGGSQYGGSGGSLSSGGYGSSQSNGYPARRSRPISLFKRRGSYLRQPVQKVTFGRIEHPTTEIIPVQFSTQTPNPFDFLNSAKEYQPTAIEFSVDNDNNDVRDPDKNFRQTTRGHKEQEYKLISEGSRGRSRGLRF